MVQKLGDTASEAGINNVAFMANFVLAEAAFFARTYLPSEISRILPLWKAELVKIHYLGIIMGSQQEGWCHLCAGHQI